MPTVHIGLNGLGRIGRALLRVAHVRDDVEVVAVNERLPASALAGLVARDTIHGLFPGSVRAEGGRLLLDGRSVPVFAAESPAEIPWGMTSASVVVEATGQFLGRETAAGHLSDRVERVILSANAPQADVTVCLGVNEHDYDPRRHRVVSNASCTTNCLATVLSVLHERFGVADAMMRTTHGYTPNQRLLDQPHPDDPRRARAAGLNIIPVTTTAPETTGRVLPDLAGRVAGMAVRVPVPAAAMLEVTARLSRDTTTEALADAFHAAARGRLRGILAISEEELVSSDFIGSPHSAVVDLPLLALTGGRLCRVVAWYDNEWGYANRLAELAARIGAPADAGPSIVDDGSP
jgi:glyceraldehyde 3-phosphate dehydrogenase